MRTRNFRLLFAGGASRAAAIVGALRQTGPAILAATLTTAAALSALGVKGLLQLAGVIASSEARQALSSLVRPSSSGEK